MSKSRRSKTRISILQFLYQWQTKEITIEEVYKQVNLQKISDLTYFRLILFGVAKHYEKLDQVISKFIDRDFNSLQIIELNILRLAVFEFLYVTETPPKVVINEAVELTKLFGSLDTSFKYINGVLDKIYNEYKKL